MSDNAAENIEGFFEFLDFFESVAIMRVCQISYFRTRYRETLVSSKILEKQVDELIIKIAARLERLRGSVPSISSAEAAREYLKNCDSKGRPKE